MSNSDTAKVYHCNVITEYKRSVLRKVLLGT